MSASANRSIEIPGPKLVVAALIERGDTVLLTRRRPDQPMGNLWELPGGKMEPGEAPEAALAREMLEELGCGATVGGVVEVVFHAYPSFDLLLLVYRVTLADEPRAVDVAECRWVARPELTDYPTLAADVALLAKLASRQL